MLTFCLNIHVTNLYITNLHVLVSDYKIPSTGTQKQNKRNEPFANKVWCLGHLCPSRNLARLTSPMLHRASFFHSIFIVIVWEYLTEHPRPFDCLPDFISVDNCYYNASHKNHNFSYFGLLTGMILSRSIGACTSI